MIKKLVIPVAGLGTRFLPVTKSIPKEMLPIVDVPTIQLLLDEAYESGIEEVLFITSKKKECIINHFNNDEELNRIVENDLEKLKILKNINKNIKINYVYQEKPLGTANAIKLSKEFVNGEAFAVIFGDNIIKGTPALKELIEVFMKTKQNVIGLKEVKDTCNYGIVQIENGIINNIFEKPKYNVGSNLAAIGRYIFTNEVFEKIENIQVKNGEYQLTDAILSFIKEKKAYPCIVTGEYFDIGSQIGFVKANISFALDRKDLKEDLLEYIKNIKEN